VTVATFFTDGQDCPFPLLNFFKGENIEKLPNFPEETW
jgi:hypothetical protein